MKRLFEKTHLPFAVHVHNTRMRIPLRSLGDPHSKHSDICFRSFDAIRIHASLSQSDQQTLRILRSPLSFNEEAHVFKEYGPILQFLSCSSGDREKSRHEHRRDSSQLGFAEDFVAIVESAFHQQTVHVLENDVDRVTGLPFAFQVVDAAQKRFGFLIDAIIGTINIRHASIVFGAIGINEDKLAFAVALGIFRSTSSFSESLR
ncbi:MAG: hypothetical protein IID44_29055 [Planctomycetes bacterium]|nr:hypothetical protein [Planctomycetota bacterium]